MHKTAKQRNHIWKKVTTIGDQNLNAVDSPGTFAGSQANHNAPSWSWVSWVGRIRGNV